MEPVEWLFAYSTQEASRAQVIHFRFSPESSYWIYQMIKDRLRNAIAHACNILQDIIREIEAMTGAVLERSFQGSGEH